MAEGQQNNKKKNPFSIYWIYALVGVVIIGFQLFMSSSGEIPVKYQSTFFDLAERGYVEDAKLVNKVRVDFKVNKDGKYYILNSTSSQYSPIKEYLNSGSNRRNSDPIFELNIIDAGNFESQVNDLNKSIKEKNKELLAAKKEPLRTIELVDV